MTVAHMRRVMSHQELIEWTIYYGRKAQREELEAAQARRG